MSDEGAATPSAKSAMAVMDRNRALLAQAQGYVYKETDGAELEAYVFSPDGHTPDRPRPAILFFFSGAWDSGLVSQFAPHCLHFAKRGMVAITFDYRVGSRHGTTPLEAMADARSAVRWTRSHAGPLGIDPAKIVGAGASAGSHLILSAAMIPGIFDDPVDDPAVSCVPDALVLFDPVVDVHSKSGFGSGKFPDSKTARLASPIRHVRKKLPPMILFQGTQDRLLAFATTEKFSRRMRRWPHRNQCRLVPFEGCGHSFFNFNVDPRLFEATINLADRFLVRLGFLDADEHGTDPRL